MLNTQGNSSRNKGSTERRPLFGWDGLFKKKEKASEKENKPEQQERLFLKEKGDVIKKTHIQWESLLKRTQLRKQSEQEIAAGLRAGTQQMDTRNSMSRAFHKELTGGLFTGGLLGPLFVGNKTNGAIKEIRNKYGDELADKVAQNVGTIKSQAPGVQEILAGEKELSRGALQLLRKLNGNMSDADIQEYWQQPNNRKNIQKSVASFAVSAVLWASTWTVFLGNMLTPIPIGSTPIPGKGVYDRTLFGGQYRGSGDPVQPAIDALGKYTRDALKNGNRTNVDVRQAAAWAVGSIGREVELARGAVNPMLGFINAIWVDTALKNKMEKYSEMMEDPNISPDELEKALKLQYEIRNRLATIKDSSDKKGKRDSDYYTLVQSTLQWISVTRDTQTLEATERGDREEAFLTHQYKRMESMLPTAGLQETKKAVEAIASWKGYNWMTREQTLASIKAQPGVKQMIQAHNSGLNGAILNYERTYRPLSSQTRINTVRGKWWEDLTGYDPRGVANYFDTRTNARWNLADNAMELIRNTLQKGGNTVDINRSELIQAIARGRIVSQANWYNTGINARNIGRKRTNKGQAVEFTVPYEVDGRTEYFKSYIVLECANVMPDGTYKIDTDALPDATIYLRVPVGFNTGGGGGNPGNPGQPWNPGNPGNPGNIVWSTPSAGGPVNAVGGIGQVGNNVGAGLPSGASNLGWFTSVWNLSWF
jgi:hypothetical protein